MPDVFDSLNALTGMQGDQAQSDFEQAPLPYETPSMTQGRVAQGQQQRVQYGRMKAEDLASRGIPYDTSGRGNVSEIMDDAGAPLTNADRTNKIAYDSSGKPVDYSQKDPTTGKRVLRDPYQFAPTKTDAAGNIYSAPAGLPWQDTRSVDPVVQQQAQQKVNAQTATALAPVEQQAKVQLAQSTKAVKASAAQLKTAAVLNGFTGIDPTQTPEQIRQAAQDNYTTVLKNDPDANKTGYFGNSGTLTPEAESKRKVLAAQQQAVMAAIDQHQAVFDQARQAQAALDAVRTQRQQFQGDKIAELNRRRVAVGLDPVSIPGVTPAAPAVAEQAPADAGDESTPAPAPIAAATPNAPAAPQQAVAQAAPATPAAAPVQPIAQTPDNVLSPEDAQRVQDIAKSQVELGLGQNSIVGLTNRIDEGAIDDKAAAIKAQADAATQKALGAMPASDALPTQTPQSESQITTGDGSNTQKPLKLLDSPEGSGATPADYPLESLGGLTQQKVAAARANDYRQPSFWESGNTPIAPLKRMGPQEAGTVARSLDQFGILDNVDPNTVDRIASVLQNVSADTVNFFQSPLGIATLGIGALPKAAQKAISAVFLAQAAHEVPNSVRDIVLAKTPEERDEAITQTIESTAVLGGTAAHILDRARAANASVGDPNAPRVTRTFNAPPEEPGSPQGLGPSPNEPPPAPSQPSPASPDLALPQPPVPEPVSPAPNEPGTGSELATRQSELASMDPRDPMRPLIEGRIKQLTEGQPAEPQAQPVAEQPPESAAPIQTSPESERPSQPSPEAQTPTEIQPSSESPAPAPSEQSSAPLSETTPQTATSPEATGETALTKPGAMTEAKSSSPEAISESAPAQEPTPKAKPVVSPTKSAEPIPPAEKDLPHVATLKPHEVLNEAKNVKLTTPKGAQFIRVTDSKGRQIVEPIANVTKGANPFHQAGPFKRVESGVLNSKKQFVALRGELTATDANAKPAGSEKPATTGGKDSDRVASGPSAGKPSEKGVVSSDEGEKGTGNELAGQGKPEKAGNVDRDTDASKLARAPAAEPTALGPANPATSMQQGSKEAQAVTKIAKAALSLHKDSLNALDHPHDFEYGQTGAGSGIETDVQSQRIRIDGEKLAEATKKMTPAARAEFVKRAVAEEVIHVGTLKYAAESAENRQKLLGLTKDEPLMEKAGKAYGPEWEKLPEFNKAAEAARMLLQGPEKLTEESYKFLKDFLEWMKSKLKNLSKDAREVLDGIRQKLGQYEKSAQETKEQAPPASEEKPATPEDIRAEIDKLKASGEPVPNWLDKLAKKEPLAAAKPEDQGPFYSQLTRTVQALPQDTMTVGQARAAVSKGAKPDEIKASGILDDPLSPLAGKDANAKVTKRELEGYAVDRQTKVQDVTLGDALKGNEKEEYLNLKQELDRGPGAYTPAARRDMYARMEELAAPVRGTHFSQYQLPGAEPDSYREQFVTWPGRDYSPTEQRPFDEAWNDGHTAYNDIANPVVRIRRNIRTDADGKKTYFIEEMQGPQKSEQEKMPPEVRKRIYEIGMKRAIRDAVDSGADAIGWTDGQTQADRYDLSKHVNRIVWTEGHNRLQAFGKDGESVIDKTVSPEELPSVLGKDVAQKLVDQKPNNIGVHQLDGDEIKVGGEGIKALYDKMLPNIANKLVEKVGGKVGRDKIPLGKTDDYEPGMSPTIAASLGSTSDIHSMDIPKAWKDEAPQFALYAATPDGSTPGPAGEESPSGKQPSGSQPDRPSTEGALTTGEDTVASRNEKLMEEAEAAGLSPSLETIKGVLRNDTAAMDKLRAMIKDRTGKEAINAATPSLGASNPLKSMRDTYDSVADHLAARAMKKEIAYKQDAVGNIANYHGQQAGDSIRLDLPEKIDREAMPFVIEAGGNKAKMTAMVQKIAASKDPKMAAKFDPIVDHAINNFDRLNKARANHDAIMAKSLAELKAAGIDVGEVENYVSRKLDAPEAQQDMMPNPLFGGGGGGGGNPKYFTKGRTFETLADAIGAGFRPKSTDLADLDAHRIEAAQKIIGQKQLFDEMKKTPSPTDGEPIIGQMEQVKKLNGKTEAQVPRGYSVVQAGGQPLVIHNDFKSIFQNLFGSSAIRTNALGRGALKAAAFVKHGTLAVDTFHIGRMLFKMATAGGGGPLTVRNGHPAWNIHKGRALLEYTDADLGRAQAMGDITKKEADYARANRPKVEKLMEKGMNVGKVADNLMEQAKLHLPIVSKLNSWIFGKLSRSAMLQASLTNLDRNLKNPNLTEDQAYRQTAKEMNELFGNLQNQGILQNKTLQDISRLIFLAPNWTESQFRNEARAYAQASKAPVNAIRGKGFRVGNSARVFAAGLAALLVGNQIINYLSRGQSTFENKEKDHKMDAYVPGGKRGFWFSPLEIAGEYAHAAMKYLAQRENPVDVATHIMQNKLSPMARGAKEALTGRDAQGKHFLNNTDRFRGAATDALPVPMFTQPFMERDPRSPTGFRATRTPAAGEKQFLQSVGMKVTAAQSPRSQMFAIAQPFRADRQTNDAAGEYTELRRALDNDDDKSAKSEIKWLYDRGKTFDQIREAVGVNKKGIIEPENFAGSKAREEAMIPKLKPDEQAIYSAAQKEHVENAARLMRIIGSVPSPSSNAAAKLPRGVTPYNFH